MNLQSENTEIDAILFDDGYLLLSDNVGKLPINLLMEPEQDEQNVENLDYASIPYTLHSPLVQPIELYMYVLSNP